ncbi:hypothetical protein ACQP00_11000 [Dactylosporangium sp. CS-047395]|uniref:hypothetical protein n=1 Tax=Dactylosporangium sp. CS-047395 TaxID=3239936 RepID=UPI003D94DE48
MKLIDLALAAVCAAALGVTAYLLADSWGGASWALDLGSGATVTVLVLLRRRWRFAPAAVLAVALAATIVSRVADQPQEPGPAAALALGVLVAWAVARRTWWIPACALGTVVATWATDTGFSAVTVINAAGWVVGVVSGTSAAVVAGSPARPAPEAAGEAGAAAGPAR